MRTLRPMKHMPESGIIILKSPYKAGMTTFSKKSIQTYHQIMQLVLINWGTNNGQI